MISRDECVIYFINLSKVLQFHIFIFQLILNSLDIVEANVFLRHLSKCIVQSIRFIVNLGIVVTKFDFNLFLLNKLFVFLILVVLHFTAALADS